MFTNILLATDGSDDAMRAAHAAAALARTFDAELTLLYVHPEPMAATAPVSDAVAFDTVARWAELERRAADLIKIGVVRGTGAVLEKEQVPFRVRVEDGHAGDVVVRAAERGGFDLIVLGSRGRSGIESFLLGSVGGHVLHHAHCPVLIARGGVSGGDMRLSQILVASDGSMGALHSTEVAAGLVRGFEGAALTVLYAYEANPPVARGMGALEDDPELRDECARAAENAVSGLARTVACKKGVCDRTSFRMEKGRPAQTILRVAAEMAPDLVVVGRRGRDEDRAFLLGSVSERVARHAPCSVLVVK